MTEPEGVIANMIEAITDQGKGLTTWEETFMISVRLQWKFRRWLSDQQETKLTRIFEERV